MADNGHGADTVKGQVEADAGTEAEPNGSELGDAGFFQSSDDFLCDGLCKLRAALVYPRPDIEVAGFQSVSGNRVALEHVNDDGLEAVPRKVICEELQEFVSTVLECC